MASYLETLVGYLGRVQAQRITREMASDLLSLFQEYRDRHGREDEDEAMSCASKEIEDGIAAIIEMQEAGDLPDLMVPANRKEFVQALANDAVSEMMAATVRAAKEEGPLAAAYALDVCERTLRSALRSRWTSVEMEKFDASLQRLREGLDSAEAVLEYADLGPFATSEGGDA